MDHEATIFEINLAQNYLPHNILHLHYLAKIITQNYLRCYGILNNLRCASDKLRHCATISCQIILGIYLQLNFKTFFENHCIIFSDDELSQLFGPPYIVNLLWKSSCNIILCKLPSWTYQKRCACDKPSSPCPKRLHRKSCKFVSNVAAKILISTALHWLDVVHI